jgi:hypothetical protein
MSDEAVSPETDEPGVDLPAEGATEDTSDTTQESPPETQPKPKGVQKRLDELTANWRTAERDRDYWREQAVRNQPPPIQAPEAPKGRPERDQYDSDAEFIEAVTDWKVSDRLQARERELEESRKAQEAEVRAQTFYERAAEIREQHPDYDAVALNPHLPITETMVEVLQSSGKGAEVLYHLGKNPSEAARIARLSPYAAAAELGRLEASLSQPKKQTAAPDPIAPVSGTGGAQTTDTSKMTAEQYREYRNKTSRLSRVRPKT